MAAGKMFVLLGSVAESSAPPAEQRLSGTTGVGEDGPTFVPAVGAQSIYGAEMRKKDLTLTLCGVSTPHSEHSAQDALSKTYVDPSKELRSVLKLCIYIFSTCGDISLSVGD